MTAISARRTTPTPRCAPTDMSSGRTLPATTRLANTSKPVATQAVTSPSERTRSRMDRLVDADLASQDVLIGVVRELEKQQWMLRAQLGQG